MKKIIAIAILLLNLNLAKAQSITDTIYFNNYASPTNNDLVNHFSNTSWITMDTIHGITGGSLITPDSLNWGNDVIGYCKNYSNVIDSMMTTSISFKFNSSLIMPTPHYERSAAIFLYSDIINHYVMYYLNRDLTLTIFTYGSVQNTLMTLTSGHWYRLVASYKSLSTPPGDNVYARAEIFDLGVNGLSLPVSIGNNTLTFHDSDLVNSAEFAVKICGARWGGGEYLDNFTFHGIPGTINCVPVSVNENILNEESITVYPQPALNVLNISFNKKWKDAIIFYSLSDISGRKMVQGELAKSDLITLPVGQLSRGLYVLQIRNNSQLISKKIIIE